MNLSSTTRRVIQLVDDVNSRGAELPEYDGLRVFQHTPRIRQHLTGEGADVIPVTLDLWPSLSCNARCPLCQYRVSGARAIADSSHALELLDVTLGNQMLLEAARAGVRSVIFTGGGEPLLNPEIISLAQSARRCGLKWGLITNGLLLTPEIAHRLFNERPSFVRVSLNAGSEESYHNTYATRPGTFELALQKTIAAAIAAAETRQGLLNISFALKADTTESELRDISNTIIHIFKASAGALGNVVFRPMLLHYEGRKPICPQRNAEKFIYLADAIENIVIKPIMRTLSNAPRFDIKKGLFCTAARSTIAKSCLSSAWMTTITHLGEGYITGELAGDKNSGQCWGLVANPGDFVKKWNGDQRKVLHHETECGRIPVPVVHRTTPVDEFLRRLADVTEGIVDNELAEEICATISKADWYRSSGADFI